MADEAIPHGHRECGNCRGAGHHECSCGQRGVLPDHPSNRVDTKGITVTTLRAPHEFSIFVAEQCQDCGRIWSAEYRLRAGDALASLREVSLREIKDTEPVPA